MPNALPSSRRPALLLATAGLSAVGITAALALPSATGTGTALRGGSIAAPVPVVTSENVSLLTTVPESGAISLEFARTGDFAYVSSTDTITVLDTSDPTAPVARGSLVNAMFENEAMTYGERVGEDGTITRFVLAGIDLYQTSPDDIENINVLGNEVLIVDVTDPDAPFIRSRASTSTSTHTVQCVSQVDCTTAYTAGTSGEFSILDLTDLDAPVERAVVASRAAGDGGPHSVFGGGFGAGHYWDFEDGLAWHSGSGGVTVFDVSDPLAPTPVNGTDASGLSEGWNDFIFHNSRRPNGDVFLEGAPPSVFNGNVLLATEEDYANEGDELLCERSGSTQTWHVPDLDAEAHAAREGGLGTIAPLDRKTADQFGGGLTLPVGAFCSAHWFDYHQDGFVAQGFYQAGLRILDVKDATEITQVGYATTGASEVFDAYWVPVRDENGVVTGEKTDIVYTTDTSRGVDVYQVTLPELTPEQAAAKAAMEERRAGGQTPDEGTPTKEKKPKKDKKDQAGRPSA